MGMEHDAAERLSVITSIEREKKSKSRYLVFLDGEFAFSVHEDVMIKYRLLKGGTVNQEQIALILHEDEKNRAYVEAIRFIGRRPRSIQEVKRHLLSKGYEAGISQMAADRLQKEGYLDDQAFAQLWSEHRIKSQKKGRRLVEQELSQKGVADEAISSALASIGRGEEWQSAWDTGSKKWRLTKGETLDRKWKVLSFLLRRGYPSSIAYDVIKKLTDGQSNSEDEVDWVEVEE